jgi:hypothetical protein
MARAVQDKKSPGYLILLALALSALAGTLWAVSRPDEAPLARFRMFGPGSVFNTVYELTTEGTLITTRYSLSGKVLERRGGYFTAEPEDLRRPEVQSKLRAAMDLPIWQVEVYRSSSEKVTTDVPDRHVGRFYPELSEISYVSTAWQLLEEFEALWDSSQVVEQ